MALRRVRRVAPARSIGDGRRHRMQLLFAATADVMVLCLCGGDVRRDAQQQR